MIIVKHLAEQIRHRIKTASDHTSLAEMAALLNSGVDCVVICRPNNTPSGIVTKTNIVKHIEKQQVVYPETCLAPWFMTTNVVTCHLSDRVDAAWVTMRAKDFKNLPVVDVAGQVVGVLNARDALKALLTETANGEELLREYVVGSGCY